MRPSPLSLPVKLPFEPRRPVASCFGGVSFPEDFAFPSVGEAVAFEGRVLEAAESVDKAPVDEALFLVFLASDLPLSVFEAVEDESELDAVV